jgi:4-hydroxyacetophenone monooxygenase
LYLISGGEKYNILIIGAGMSGLDVAKKLKEIGVPFKILEKAPRLGGTW